MVVVIFSPVLFYFAIQPFVLVNSLFLVSMYATDTSFIVSKTHDIYFVTKHANPNLRSSRKGQA